MENTTQKDKRLALIKKSVLSRRTPVIAPIVKMEVTDETVEIPGLFQPSEYDLRDELIRMDSFAYQGSSNDTTDE